MSLKILNISVDSRYLKFLFTDVKFQLSVIVLHEGKYQVVISATETIYLIILIEKGLLKM